jgi:hypothetical protein
MASVKVKRGSEGPEHDPYAFTEITFYFTDPERSKVVYHRGLGEWLKYDGRKYDESDDWLPSSIDYLFKHITGLSVRKAESIPDMLFERSMRKYSKEERWQIMECIEADEAMLRNCY